jgi:hypothetical protein
MKSKMARVGFEQFQDLQLGFAGQISSETIAHLDGDRLAAFASPALRGIRINL